MIYVSLTSKCTCTQLFNLNVFKFYSSCVFLCFLFIAAADSRADHDHQAVTEGADPNHEVGQRQPVLEQADGPLTVVVSVEQD